MCRAIAMGRRRRLRLILLASLFLSLSAYTSNADNIQFFQPSGTAAPELLFGADARSLTGQVEQALIEATGFADLKSFAVHWDRPTFRCLTKSYEQFPDVTNGVCLVEADAFQVRATALIVKRSSGFEVSILDLLVE